MLVDIGGENVFVSYLIVEATHSISYKKVQYRAGNVHIYDAVVYGTLQYIKQTKGYEDLDAHKRIM